MPIDNRTANLNLALPHVDNPLEDDVARLRSALDAIDAAIFAKASAADITNAINAVLDGAPAALDTLNELAAAIDDNASYAASITSALAGKAAVSHTHALADVTGLIAALAAKLDATAVASAGTLGAVRVGAGLSIDGAGILSASGGGVSNTFTEQAIVPSSNGQTVFTPAGGYAVGQIELFLNGVLLYSGDDYTASNGTTITLTTGALTADTLLLRKWSLVGIAGAVQKSGDTMTGALNEARGSDIASASTLNLTAATGNLVDVTGTTTVTAITLADGAERTVRFTGALTLTNGASLVLPGGANIVTAAGDFAVFRGYAAGVVRCTNYARASGQAVVGSAGDAAQVLTDAATIAWNINSGNVASVTLNVAGATRVIGAPTNLRIGSYVLTIKQDATGNRGYTWNPIFQWGAGAPPIPSTAANAKDVFTFIYDGTNLVGSYLRGVA